MMHNNAHIAAIDLDRRNDVVFRRPQVTDCASDGGDGLPLGALRMLGKVQGVMAKSWATIVPLRC